MTIDISLDYAKQLSNISNKNHHKRTHLTLQDNNYNYDYNDNDNDNDNYLSERNKPRKSHSHKRITATSLIHILSIIPVVILTYLQLVFNLLIVGIVVYSSIKFLWILQNDLDKHMQNQSHILLGDVIQCSREYIRNGCGNNMAPALDSACGKWEICMNGDTTRILQSKETAVLFAEILNNFFANLTDRTIYCSSGIFIGSIFIANAVLSWGKRIPVATYIK